MGCHLGPNWPTFSFHTMKKLAEVFREGMLMMFLYFLNHLNLPTHFANICPLNTRNFTTEHENIGSLWFLDVKICRKNNEFVTSVYRKPTFSRVFTNYESFIPTYQKRDFYKHYFIGVLVYAVISKHFMWKSII